MQIGYAQTVIAPSLNRTVCLAGFGQNRGAESVHDGLYARPDAAVMAVVRSLIHA